MLVIFRYACPLGLYFTRTKIKKTCNLSSVYHKTNDLTCSAPAHHEENEEEVGEEVDGGEGGRRFKAVPESGEAPEGAEDRADAGGEILEASDGMDCSDPEELGQERRGFKK